MKAELGQHKCGNQWFVLLACALLLVGPLMSTLAQASVSLPLPHATNNSAYAADLPGAVQPRPAGRVASAALTGVLGGPSIVPHDVSGPAPRALHLEWATNTPPRYARAASVRLIELLAN